MHVLPQGGPEVVMLQTRSNLATVLQVEPLLKVMGSSILDCGDTAKAGSIMKLVGNFTFMSYVETVSEALALADAGGLPAAASPPFLTGSSLAL